MNSSILQKAVFLAIPALLLLCCAPKKTLLTNRNLHQAKNLQLYCHEHKIQTAETRVADSLLAASYKSLEIKEDELAYWQSDMATIYYKISITNKELMESEKKLGKIKKDLEKDREHLTSLKEVYEEIKSLRR
jgi:hypothetical protein